MKPLDIDEIMALYAFRLEDADIMKMHLDDFERMLDENPDLDFLLSKVNALLDCQEAQGVVSIPWDADSFPERFRKIDRHCSAIIHCKGNLELLLDRTLLLSSEREQLTSRAMRLCSERGVRVVAYG